MTRAANEMLVGIPAERAAFVGAHGEERRDLPAGIDEDEWIVAVRRSIRRTGRYLIDLRDAAAGTNIQGVIVGRALYDGRIDPKQALTLLSHSIHH